MKKIEAIIRPSALEAVRDALTARGIGGLTVTEVTGFGHTPGHAELYRGASYRVDFQQRIRLEVITTDPQAGPIAHAIADAARTGRVGDGLVMILPVGDAIRIRTSEHGDAAIAEPGRAEQPSYTSAAPARAAAGSRV